MNGLFWSALFSQGLLMMVDEFYFHWKRDLPKWERLGHPLDTFFFLLPLGILSFSQATAFWKAAYFVVSVLSSLVITKDEWVHRDATSPVEQWIHSVLFILHPVVLISGFFVWTESSAPFVWIWSGVSVFLLYQILFWNFYADRIFKTRLGNY